MPIPSINTNWEGPSYGLKIDQMVELAISDAHLMFETWKETSFEERSNVLQNVANLMRTQKTSLAKRMSADTGMLLQAAKDEVTLGAAIFDRYARQKELPSEEKGILIEHSPKGVLLGVITWAKAFSQVARFVAPNIMTGNTILIKHSSRVRDTANSIEELFCEAGAPKGLYTSLYITRKHSYSLINDSRIRGIWLNIHASDGTSSAITMEVGMPLRTVIQHADENGH